MTVNHKEYDIGNGKSIIAYYDDKDITEISREAFEKVVIPALRKAEKYKWHDLRKNPQDLPTEYKVLACCQGMNGLHYETLYYGKPFGAYPQPKGKVFYGSDSEWGDYTVDDVLAWKHIEPFESEVEE